MSEKKEQFNCPDYAEAHLAVIWDEASVSIGLSVENPRSPTGERVIIAHTVSLPFDYLASNLEKIAIDLRAAAHKLRKDAKEKAPKYHWMDEDWDGHQH